MDTAVSTGSTLNITASINPTITTPVPTLTPPVNPGSYASTEAVWKIGLRLPLLIGLRLPLLTVR